MRMHVYQAAWGGGCLHARPRDVASGPLQVLAHVALRMRTLHRTGYAHCNISPSTVKWFPQDNMWKLAEFHHAARCGDTRRSGAPGLVGVSPHYAAPETMNVRPLPALSNTPALSDPRQAAILEPSLHMRVCRGCTATVAFVGGAEEGPATELVDHSQVFNTARAAGTRRVLV